MSQALAIKMSNTLTIDNILKYYEDGLLTESEVICHLAERFEPKEVHQKLVGEYIKFKE